MYKSGYRLLVALLAAGLLGACASQDWDRGGGGGGDYPSDYDQEATGPADGGGGGGGGGYADPTATPVDQMDDMDTPDR